MQAIKNSNKRQKLEIMKKLTGLFFCESAVLANMVSQISSTHKVYHQIKVVAIFEWVVHIHKESKVKHS